MTAPAFDAASWVQRAEAIGLAIVDEHGVNLFLNVKGTEADELWREWRGGREEHVRAACAYAGSRSTAERLSDRRLL